MILFKGVVLFSSDQLSYRPAGMALKQKMARFRARAQNMRSTNNLLKGKSADVSEPLTPKILATMLSPRAFLRRIRDQSARKPAAAEVARDLLSPPEPPSPTAAAAKEETKGKNEMQLAIPLSASLRGLPIDPEVFDSTGSTPLNTGTNSPAATPPLTPQGSARFDPGDLARIIKDGRGEKKGGFTRFRREDSSLKSALADALPQLAAGHERRKSRMTTSTSSHEDVTSTKALAACAKLGIDLAKPLDLNATWRAGTPLRLRNRGGSGLPAEEINRVTPLSPRAASSLLAEQSDNVLDPVAEPSPNPNGDTLHLDEPAPSTSSGEPTEELPSSAVPRGLRGRKQRTARFLEGLKSVSSQKKVSLPSSGEETNMGILPVPNLPRLHMPGAKVASADGKKPRALQRSTSSPHIVLRPARGGHTKATEKRRLTRRLSITALMKPKVQWKSLIRLIDQRPLKKPSLARHLSFAHIPSLHLRSDPITILARKATRGREKGPLRRGSSKAFFLLKDQHPLRIKIHQLIADKRFARLVTAVVVVSMLILMADRPSMREGGREWKGIVMLDAVFAGLFATEVLLKMTAVRPLFLHS